METKQKPVLNSINELTLINKLLGDFDVHYSVRIDLK